MYKYKPLLRGDSSHFSICSEGVKISILAGAQWRVAGKTAKIMKNTLTLEESRGFIWGYRTENPGFIYQTVAFALEWNITLLKQFQ